MHGQFVWYELTTPDPDASIRFYPKLTSWGTQPFDKDYTMFTHRGVPVAGIFRQTEEMKTHGVPPNWMPYIETTDVDATAAKAKSLGASIMAGPDDIPETGRFAVVQDPQGAVFGIYKSNRPSQGYDGTNEVGKFSWHELMTGDRIAATKFYNSLFGWEKNSEMDMGGGMMYYIFGRDGKMYGGIYDTPKEMAGMHPFWLVYIHVKDVAKSVDIATRNGAQVHRPQMDIPGGSIAILGDPTGAGFAVHHNSPAAAATAGPAAPKKKAVVKSKAKSKTKPKTKTKTKAKSKSAPKSKAKTKSKAKAKAKAPAKKKAKARVVPKKKRAKGKR